MWRWLSTILILPINVLVIIPSLIFLIIGKWPDITPYPMALSIGVLLLILGLGLALWTMFLFGIRGKGTPAPWDPPTRLVVKGPYQHVRNPMMTSVFIMQIAEVLIFNSYVIAIWFAVFLAANMIYLPFFEEKDLEKRFGADYILYKRHVPRWVPRIRP